MPAKTAKTKFAMLLLGALLVTTAWLSVTPFCLANDHKESQKHYDKHAAWKGAGGLGAIFDRRSDEGNEMTGETVAWSLAAANLTVALSLLIRGVKRFAPLGPEVKGKLARFNRTQKKYLMRFHYLLNPLILALAMVHWILSRCKSTALPEWGLLTMSAIVALGVILKFKLCPQNLLRNVYQVHTQPLVFLLLISMLVIGHLSMH